MTIDKSHTSPDESQANTGKSQNGPDNLYTTMDESQTRNKRPQTSHTQGTNNFWLRCISEFPIKTMF